VRLERPCEPRGEPESAEAGLALELVGRDDQFHRGQRRRYLPCGDESEAANHHHNKHNHENLDHFDPFHMPMNLTQASASAAPRMPQISIIRARQPFITLRRWTMMFTLDLNCDYYPAV
jgi:hypothetical protein